MSDTVSNTSSAPQPLPRQAHALLTTQKIIRVSGPAADKFLNGQFSQSLDDVTDTWSPRAAACTPKGRAYALTRLVRDGEDILLNLPDHLAERTLTHLKKFLMLFRGTTMEVESGASLVGMLGSELADRLLPGASDQLAQPCATASLGQHRLVRTQDTADGLQRFELWQLAPLTPEQSQVIENDTVTNELAWQASELAAGIASLNETTWEGYVPQMLNWQHLNGVHFKKGCYTGQEVIARMHFLGQLKKSLFRLRTQASPEAGDVITAGERSVGEIVNAVPFANGTSEVLAVLRHDSVRSSLTLTNGTPLYLLDLPYTVPEQGAGTV